MAQNYVLRSGLVRRDVDGFCHDAGADNYLRGKRLEKPDASERPKRAESDAYLSRSVRHWRSDLRASHGRYTDLRTCGNGLSVSGNRRILAFDSWSLLETFDHVGMLAFHYRRFCRLVLSFTGLGEEFPALLGGFLAAGIGQIVGSLLPLRMNRECVRNWQENKDKYLYIAQ